MATSPTTSPAPLQPSSFHEFLLEKGFPPSRTTLTLLQVDSLWHKVARAWLQRQPSVGAQSQKEQVDRLMTELAWYRGLAKEFADQMKVRMDQLSKISLGSSTPEEDSEMFITMAKYFYPDPELHLCWRTGPVDDPYLTQESILQMWKDFCHSDQGAEVLEGLSWGSSPRTLPRELYRPGVESIPEVPPKIRAQWYDYWTRAIQGKHRILKVCTETSVVIEIIGHECFILLVKKPDSKVSLTISSFPEITTEEIQSICPELDLTPGKIYCHTRYCPLFKGDWTSLPTAKLKVPITSLQWEIHDHPYLDDAPEVPTKK